MNDEPSLESLMARVADDFLERLDRGEEPDVEDYARRHPQIADFIRQMFPTLQVMRGPRPLEASADEPPVGRLGEFRVVRQVGRGGMGVVYEAVQESLGRRVALKVLPFAAALDARQLSRFKIEAQAAGQLHHTNIVPVYGVGSERGVHFYAMQFIDGWPLTAVLEQLRGQAASPTDATEATGATPARGALTTLPSAGSTAFFETVARWGEQVAEALDYAHNQGVIHRDVKPANLLLDGQGNPWVTDFGLAHVSSEARLTMTGDLIGTLRYMSPEQALGRRGAIDHRTDVYSLGATLYELLTLRPAYEGGDRQGLLRQIAFEEPPAARVVNRQVPAELDTIVHKAMAKEPAERYATAAELAADLRRFRECLPIRARRPTLRQRAAKWTRRNRVPLLAAAAAAVLAQTLTLAVLLVKNAEVREQKLAVETALGSARDSAEIARSEEEKARLALEGEKTARQKVQDEQKRTRQALALAEKNYVKARDVVDRLVMNFSEKARGEPQMNRFGRELCQMALAEYRAFLEDAPNDREGEYRLAVAHLRLGSLHTMLGETDQAETALRTALTRFADLAAKVKQNNQLLSQQAQAHEELAKLYFRRLDRRALADAREAIDLQRQALEQKPGDADYRRLLAGHYMVCANFRNYWKQRPEAAADIETGVRLYRELAAERKDDARSLLDLGRGLLSLGTLHLTGNDHVASEKVLREAAETLDRSAALEPGGLHLQPRSTVRTQLAAALEGQKKTAAAEEQYREALGMARELAIAFPENPSFANRLAVAQWKLGALLHKDGRSADARPLLEQAAATQRQASKSDPRNVIFRQVLFSVLSELSAAQATLGDHAAAAAAARELRTAGSQPQATVFLTHLALYRAAQSFCRCAAAARDDVKTAEADRTRLADGYEAEAVAAFAEGLKHGLRSNKPWDQDDTLKPLRRRDDFKALLRAEAARKKSD